MSGATMRAMVLARTGSLADDGGDPPLLELRRLPVPEPGPGEVLVRVQACGVCHTDLDQAEGRIAPPRLPVVLGHQAVGRVAALGAGVAEHRPGDRVGVGWIHASTGKADENLSPSFRATGRDADGGYAEYLTVGERYAHPIPDAYADAEAAPLLCAGAVGYRALTLAGLRDGEPLGLTGFGGSAHLVLQLARYRYPSSPVYVFARRPRARETAIALGAAWAGAIEDDPPRPPRAVIDTTPAWRPVIAALAALQPGGRLVINAIRKEDRDRAVLGELRYHEHLWLEREVKSVANVTGRDIHEFLTLAPEVPIRPAVATYPLEQAVRALVDVRRGDVTGSKVLLIG